MRQNSNFQNLGSKKQFFRDKINKGILSHFEAEDHKKIKKKVDNLNNTVHVLQSELREKYSQIHLMEKQQELRDKEIRMELKIKEAALELLRKSDLQST